MKSQSQIRIFLRTVNPATEEDGRLIEEFGQEHGITVEFGREVAFKTISFADFELWVDEIVPRKGDPISFLEDGSLGILLFVYPDTLMMGAILKEGELCPYQHTIPYAPYRYATPEERTTLQRAFSQNGLSWSKKHSQLVSRMIPTNNSMVKVSRINEKLGMGIYRETDSTGKVIMYCLKMGDNPIRFSLNEELGSSDDYQFELLNNKERGEIKRELSFYGRAWNGRASRIEPINMQAERGCLYYYINESLSIAEACDFRKKRDISRYMSGNYYRNREEAEQVKYRLVEYRKKQLITSVTKTESVRRKDKFDF